MNLFEEANDVSWLDEMLEDLEKEKAATAEA